MTQNARTDAELQEPWRGDGVQVSRNKEANRQTPYFPCSFSSEFGGKSLKAPTAAQGAERKGAKPSAGVQRFWGALDQEAAQYLPKGHFQASFGRPLEST